MATMEQVRPVSKIPVEQNWLWYNIRIDSILQGIASMQTLLSELWKRPYIPVKDEPILCPTTPELGVLIEDFNRLKLTVRESYYSFISSSCTQQRGDVCSRKLNWRLCSKQEATYLLNHMSEFKGFNTTEVKGFRIDESQWIDEQGVKRSFNSSYRNLVADLYVSRGNVAKKKLRFLMENNLWLQGRNNSEQSILDSLQEFYKKGYLNIDENQNPPKIAENDALCDAVFSGAVTHIGAISMPMELTKDITLSETYIKRLIDELLSRDTKRADITEYDPRQLEDPNRGSWELWETEQPGFQMAEIGEKLYARDPRRDIIKGGVIGIDFGTKSTVVVCQDNSDRVRPIRVGMGRFERTPRAEDYENPTVMQFANIEQFMADYSTSNGRPLTSWSDLMVSHTAYENWKENDKTERYFSFFSDLKQWAGHPNHRVRIRDDKGKEIDLPPYAELKEGDMDPIELYAYYIGLYINNMHTSKIYLEYLLSFPVTYSIEVRRHILNSFRTGLKRSLPNTLVNDAECMEQFEVREGAGEPAAYAVCALLNYHITPAKGEIIPYGVFDFGGGTTDFDYGIWRRATGAKERRYRYVIEHFGDGGDQYLGGENLLELMAFQVFKDNQDRLRAQQITFTLPPQEEPFPGSEFLLADSQEARTNMHQLMEVLRPLWERPKDYEKQYTSGVVKVRLFCKNGEKQESFELSVDTEKLENLLLQQIKNGVEKFFSGLLTLYTSERYPQLKDGKQIYLFLAGNSSKSQLLQEQFNEAKESYEARIRVCAQEDGWDEVQEVFHVFPPLGTEESNTISANGVEALERPTGKTGVAIGLVQCRAGSNIKVINEKKADEEIKFRFWVGWNEEDFFSKVLSRNSAYGTWVAYLDAGERWFEFYYTTSPMAEQSGKLLVSETKKIRLSIPEATVDEDWMIYLRPVNPNTLEYVVAEDEDAVKQEMYQCKPQTVTLE